RGCGKTRLALQVAADLLDEFPDGAWLVELAALADPAAVPKALAAALRVQERPGFTLLDGLVRHLQSRTLLLTLDNCEHLVEACAQVATALLSGCPELRILATSREPLHIAGEVAWRVPSLAVPVLCDLPPAEELARYAAVQLFVERARAVTPAFALTPCNAPSVARVC